MVDEKLKNKLNELEQLGSAWAIATYLEDRKIKGIPKDEDACALVNYLLDSSDEFNIASNELSPNLLAFVRGFDNGDYPNLIQ